MRRAFTLVEVLTVIVIIGILASLTLYIFSASLARSRDSQRLSDLQSLKNALEQYYLDHRQYPPYQENSPEAIYAARWQLEQGFDCQGVAKFLAPTYLDMIPEDPRYKLGALVPPCSTNYFGQYLYFPLPKTGPPSQFYLIARMERVININWQDPILAELTAAGYQTQGYLTPCEAAAYQQNPAVCSHNFAVSSSRND